MQFVVKKDKLIECKMTIKALEESAATMKFKKLSNKMQSSTSDNNKKDINNKYIAQIDKNKKIKNKLKLETFRM